MPYYITGILTFSSQTLRNNARTAVNSVSLGSATGFAGIYAAGITNISTTQMSISLSIESEAEARVVARALFNAFNGVSVRTAGHLSTVKGPG